ncbi:MAG TPA: phage shock protein A [Candidatus Latescibacteria bacterium]|nr:phage shock protein A [Gemmatimonadota bacterium]HCR16245.1 phage shock protein A [Candidatus Latescibacterota bacterium]|tara:strand:+ start:550 stop:1248 length:699 start_codon:yes stop_codon:yes gene_type:complete
MGIFQRVFRVGKAEAHATIDKFEDPIKMTEQGIRDLKKDLNSAMTALAEVKGQGIRLRKQASENKKAAGDYERKAMLVLQKAQGGDLDSGESDRLAGEALSRKEDAAKRAATLTGDAKQQETTAAQLQAQVDKLKAAIATYENDLVTLRARAKTAAATKKINKQLSKVDSNGTLAMLERMKERVEEDESLAEAYGDMADSSKSLDDEIDAVIDDKGAGSDQLAELKAKMGMS